MKDFKLALRPNNQITVTRQNTIKRQNSIDTLDAPRRLSKTTITKHVRQTALLNDLNTLYSHNLKHEYLDKPRAILPIRLDLINGFQQAAGKPTYEKLGYGKTPKIKYFSHKSGQKVRESGAIIDMLCAGDLSRCRVVTLTIPSSGDAAYRAISNYSGYAVNRIFQPIRTHHPDCRWFYVYEHQKRGALHLHICIYSDKPEVSTEIGKKLLTKWREVLEDISKMSGVDLLYSKGFGSRVSQSQMQCLNQPMHFGCGAYFSKYASKNSGKYSDDINSINARKYPPSTFWGRDRKLAKLCEDNSISFKYEGVLDNDSESLQIETFELLSQFDIVSIKSFSFKKEILMDRSDSTSTLTICEGESTVFYLSPSDYQLMMVEVRKMKERYQTTSTLQNRKKTLGN